MAKHVDMRQRQLRRLVIPFLAPVVLFYATLTLYPALTTFYFSVLEWDGEGPPEFVGSANFQELLADSNFVEVLGHTLWFTVVGGAILFPLAMFLAYVTQHLRGGRAYRFLILAPITLSVTTAALIWKFMVNPNFGLLQWLLTAIGLKDQASFALLGDGRTAMLVVVLASVWHGVGMWMLLFAAGFNRIPPELLEAASLDGATGLKAFRYVVFPLTWRVTRTLLILWVISGLQVFAFIVALTNGGPLGATETMGTYVYRVAFDSGRFGYGAAVAVVLFFIVAVFTVLTQRIGRDSEVEF